MNRARIPNVLTVAGSDPSGGAGVQADLKTFAAFGVYGAAVLTALTAQNTMGVSGVYPVDADFVRQQLDAVLTDVRIDAIKIGMLGTMSILQSIVSVLPRHQNVPVVLDPVLRSSTGHSLLDASARWTMWNELLPLATIVTPNTDEVAAMLGGPAPRTIAECRHAAEVIRDLGARNVLITGGHLDAGDECVDILCDEDDMIYEMRSLRVPGPDRHGTGCTLSSAIASLLALGRDLHSACEEAQAYVRTAIVAASTLDVGRGAGPLNHVPYTRALAAQQP